MPIRHAFVSAKSDGADPSLLQPSHWDADHVGAPADKLWVPGSDPYGLDDEFNDASIDGSWILVNPSPVRATWTEGADVLSCYVASGNGAGQYNAIMKPLAGNSFPLTFETAFRYLTQYAYSYFMQGIILSNSTTWGSGVAIDTQNYTANDYAVSGHVRLHTQAVAYNSDSTPYGSQSNQWTGSAIYHRLVWSAANTFSMYTSPDGVSWLPIATGVSFAITPTHFGLYNSTWAGGSPAIGSHEFIRVY
jgi:hypothetical protein